MSKEYVIQVPFENERRYVVGISSKKFGEKSAKLTVNRKEAIKFKNTKKAHSMGKKLLRKCKNVKGYYIVEYKN